MTNDLQKVREVLAGFVNNTKSGLEKDRSAFVTAVSKQFMESLAPVLQELARNSKITKDELSEVLREIKVISPDIKLPDIHIPEIKLPTINVPASKVNVSVPEIKVPSIVMPSQMKVTGDVSMSGYSNKRPFPVMMFDQGGKPMMFPQSMGASGGKADFFTILGIQNTTASALVDSSGIAYSGSNPFPTTATATLSAATGQGDGSAALRTIQAGDTVSSVIVNSGTITTVTTLTGITNSVAATIIDSSGVGYSGSNPVPTTIVSGALTSTIAVGPSASGAADDGSGPIQIGGLARTTNPTKNTDGQVVKSSHDAVGRQLMRSVQVRELLATAYVQVTTGTETTLRAAVAGAYLDLVYIMGANSSDAAVSVDIRPVTAGNVVMTLQIPASGTTGIACPIPLPATDTGNNWTADLPDITGTTVSLTALFSKEV